MKEKCVSCKLNKNSIPKPTVSLLRATKFNQVVTLDLKEFKKRSEEKFRYILYIIECSRSGASAHHEGMETTAQKKEIAISNRKGGKSYEKPKLQREKESIRIRWITDKVLQMQM